MKKLMLAALTVTVGVVSANSEALWMRDVKISPDGSTIAFTYKGDIYTVGSQGGKATRLTSLESYEANPIWSPDGRQIAFSSDRHGNLDVFVMDADGANQRRLTTNSASEIPETFSPDGSEVWFSAAIQAPQKSAMFPTGRMTQFYGVKTTGGKSRQILGTPAQMPSFSTSPPIPSTSIR